MKSIPTWGGRFAPLLGLCCAFDFSLKMTGESCIRMFGLFCKPWVLLLVLLEGGHFSFTGPDTWLG